MRSRTVIRRCFGAPPPDCPAHHSGEIASGLTNRAAVRDPASGPDGPASGFDARLPFLRAIAILIPVTFLGLALLVAIGPLHGMLRTAAGFVAAMVVLALAVTFFASMVFAAFGRLQAALVRQGREMAALLDVGQRVTASLDPDEVMKHGVLAVVASGKAEAAEIWTVDAAHSQVTLRKRSGANGGPLFERATYALGEGIPGEVAASGRIWLEGGPDGRPPGGAAGHGSTARAAFPLRSARGVNGILAVAVRQAPVHRTPGDTRVLADMADRIALALDTANLHEQVQARAAITERERIARELHDGMAQILTYIGAKTHAVELLLQRGQPDEAQRQLAQMAEVAQGLYAEVREAILALRTGVPDGGNLVTILGNYLAELESLTGLSLRLDVAGAFEELPAPSPMAEIQVLRIVQEALSNVRQHARATEATVGLCSDGRGLEVTVRDNGRGFDQQHVNPDGRPRFGLQSMEERAKATGGSLSITSARERGTTVTLRVPVAREVEA